MIQCICSLQFAAIPRTYPGVLRVHQEERQPDAARHLVRVAAVQVLALYDSTARVRQLSDNSTACVLHTADSSTDTVRQGRAGRGLLATRGAKAAVDPLVRQPASAEHMQADVTAVTLTLARFALLFLLGPYPSSPFVPPVSPR